MAISLPLLTAYDERSVRHHAGAYHPERPERLSAALRGLSALQFPLERLPPRLATLEELARVHAPSYLEQLFGAHELSPTFLDADTYVVAGSADAVRHASGAALAAIDAQLAGRGGRAAVLVRPPGHHARRAHAMGFCLLNHAAVAAEHARRAGLSRIAIVDFDVHHGNGTQEIFYARPDVLYASLHQYPFYPGTGAATERGVGDGEGFTLNVPLSAGCEDAVYRDAFTQIVLPVLEAYAPELLIVSAGFDAAFRDPLSDMRLSDHAYRWMLTQLGQLADRCARGRLLLLLEGGYDLSSIEHGLHAALRGMVGDAEPLPTVAARGYDDWSRDLEFARCEAARRWKL